MEELKLGTLIRITVEEDSDFYDEDLDFYTTGDIARICLPPWYMRGDGDTVKSAACNYWADFNDCGNTEVFADGIWSVGQLGKNFEIVEEEVS